MSAPQDVPGHGLGVVSLSALGPTPSPARLARSPDRPDRGRRRREHRMRALQAGPPAQGLYDPRFEHDACGVAFVATLTGERQPRHRGAGAHRPAQPRPPRRRRRRGQLRRRRGDPDPGARRVPARRRRLRAPGPGAYAVGTAFLEGDADQVAKTRQRIEELADEEGLAVLGWRDVPVDPASLGATAPWRDAAVQPALRRRPRASRMTGHGAGAAWRSACASAPSTRPTSTSAR